MTLAVMALYADGPTRLRNIASWRVKETDRIAAMATELRKLGADGRRRRRLHRGHAAARAGSAAAIHTYDDHRMAMCLSLAASTRWRRRRRPCRCASSTRAASAKTFPDYFETLFAVASAGADDVPVITIDGPTASGKGTLAAAVAARLGYHLLDSGALYRATALAALRDGIDADDAAGAGAHRGPARPALRRRPDHAARPATVRDELRRGTVGAMASRVLAHCRRCARRCTACSWRSAARPGWSPTGATWAPSSSPTPRSRCFSPRAPHSAPSAAISS